MPVRLVVGLGNPGKDYSNTRHNVGFKVVDLVLNGLLREKVKFTSKYEALVSSVQISGRKVFFIKPMTFMNLSGHAVSGLCRKEKIVSDEIILIHDDMDIEQGRIKLKIGGGAAGHNGVESVILELGTDKFARLRIGIGRDKFRIMTDYVLSEFKEEEKVVMEKSLDLSAEAVKLAVRRGFTTAMNKYNRIVDVNVDS